MFGVIDLLLWGVNQIDINYVVKQFIKGEGEEFEG